jgi:hypothetical protein
MAGYWDALCGSATVLLLSTLRHQRSSMNGCMTLWHLRITPQVFPESVDLKPGAQATFRVAFRPTRDGVHVAQLLTLCAHVKSMRNFRLVSDSQASTQFIASGASLVAAAPSQQAPYPSFIPPCIAEHYARHGCMHP